MIPADAPHNYLTFLGDLVAWIIFAAMVAAFSAIFVLWVARKALRAWARWMRVERADIQYTKEDDSVEEKK